MLQQGDDPEEALLYAKLELFHDQVFCFTPKGQVIALPKGATTLDFAYAVHTDIGDQFVGAKINGVRMPIRTPLKNSDVVEIDTSVNAVLPSEWTTLVTTGRARSGIRRRIKRMRLEEQARLGREMAESVFAGAKLEFSPKAIKEAVRKLVGEKGKIEDVLAKVGAGELTVNQLVEAAYPGAALEAEGEIRPAARRAFSPRAAIIGLPPRAPVRMGKCCAPVPGERIVGVRDADGAITVHAIHCETWEREDPPESSLLDLGWNKDSEGAFGFSQVLVTVRNEVGVLSEVAAAIARYGVSIANIKMRNHSADFVDLYIDVEIRNERQLAQMLAGLRAISTVISAERREDFVVERE
jgi:(p)ppGpp synthase/HD superfamily hydrolase